ncbi:glutathione S-transferase family protein [Marinobacter zhejiangensis]|uniref:Glutathione S-transferase n=1 Tax=Marinobacter zhejiangensis TaxID=488535 RepID=A0A1I4LMC5_9GAMM|nr:glutathione S-transferase family protein [Marinobacter zhejiangensis]SFL91973.1 Glutathione S-transferase [Marinobacter zhejiangensis]
MKQPALVIGSYLSPYVRKVLAVLEFKGIPYQIDPIVPFFGNDAFTELNPARRIPVLIDGDNTVLDSSVIIEYLNEQYPEPPLLPTAAADRARARWLEEYADSVMGEVFIWRYYNQVVINRFVWGNSPDEAVLRQTAEQDLPQVFDFLESQLPETGAVLGALSTADIALASFFRNLQFARYPFDEARWPRTAAFVTRTLALPCFSALRPYEELCMRTAIPQHREALQDAGAPISAQSYGSERPRKGILSV